MIEIHRNSKWPDDSVTKSWVDGRPFGLYKDPILFSFFTVRDKTHTAEQSFYAGASCFPPLDNEAIMELFLSSLYEVPIVNGCALNSRFSECLIRNLYSNINERTFQGIDEFLNANIYEFWWWITGWITEHLGKKLRFPKCNCTIFLLRFNSTRERWLRFSQCNRN